jgi:hypothetical protein
MPVSQLDLTARDDSGVSAAILVAMAALARHTTSGPGSRGDLAAPLDRLRGARRRVGRARRIEGAYRDGLRPMLAVLHDHAWALSRVLASQACADGDAGDRSRLAQLADGFGEIGAVAAELLVAVTPLEAI